MKKRIISIILCFLIGITVMPASFAAEGGTFNRSLNSDAIDLLTAVGVLGEDDVFIMQETETVTKGEFARVLLSLVGMRDQGEAIAPFENLYNDVKANTAYANEILAATKLGYFGDKLSGYFYPDDRIKTDWALKAIMRALGYAHSPNYYKTDLTDGVRLTTYLNRSNTLKAFRNALEVPVIDYDSYSTDGAAIGKTDGITVLQKYLNVTVSEGVVLADCYSSVQGKRADEGHIRIGDKQYAVGMKDATGLVGLNVKYYVHNDDATESIVYIEEKQNFQVTIPGNNLEYSYKDNKYTTVEGKKRVTYKLYSHTKVSYNGYPDFDKNLMAPGSGYVTLIDNDNDKDIDVVKIMAYRNMIVFGNNLVSEEIQDKLNPNKNLILRNYKNVNVYAENGSKTTVGNILMEDVLTVYESPDKANVDIYISKPASAMIIDEMYDGDYGKVIVADGNEYTLAEDPDDLFNEDSLYLGQKYDFYINQWNELFYATPAWDSRPFWILEAGKSGNSGLNSIISIKGMLSTGIIETLQLGKKIKWIEFGLRERISDTEALKRLCLADGETINRQLLKLSFNKEKVVSEIIVAYEVNARETIMSMNEDYPLIKASYINEEWPEYALYSAGGVTSYFNSDRSFYYWLHFANGCTEFCVNTNETAEEELVDDEDMYAKGITFRNKSYDIRLMDFYLNSKESIAVDYVVRDASGGGKSNNVGDTKSHGVVLNKIIYTKNKNDEFVPTLICTMSDGAEVRYVLEKEEIISIETLKANQASYSGSSVSIHPNKKSLAPGDVIAVDTNERGEAIGVVLLYDYENKHDSRNGSNFKADRVSESITGRIARKQGNIAELVIISEDANNGAVININMPNNIIAFNVNERTSQKATINDLLVNDLVVVCFEDLLRRTVVVYRE